jgi:hypothetical protein
MNMCVGVGTGGPLTSTKADADQVEGRGTRDPGNQTTPPTRLLFIAVNFVKIKSIGSRHYPIDRWRRYT